MRLRFINPTKALRRRWIKDGAQRRGDTGSRTPNPNPNPLKRGRVMPPSETRRRGKSPAPKQKLGKQPVQKRVQSSPNETGKNLTTHPKAPGPTPQSSGAPQVSPTSLSPTWADKAKKTLGSEGQKRERPQEAKLAGVLEAIPRDGIVTKLPSQGVVSERAAISPYRKAEGMTQDSSIKEPSNTTRSGVTSLLTQTTPSHKIMTPGWGSTPMGISEANRNQETNETDSIPNRPLSNGAGTLINPPKKGKAGSPGDELFDRKRFSVDYPSSDATKPAFLPMKNSPKEPGHQNSKISVVSYLHVQPKALLEAKLKLQEALDLIASTDEMTLNNVDHIEQGRSPYSGQSKTPIFDSLKDAVHTLEKDKDADIKILLMIMDKKLSTPISSYIQGVKVSDIEVIGINLSKKAIGLDNAVNHGLNVRNLDQRLPEVISKVVRPGT